MKEFTLVLLKPDAVERNLIGKVIATFEEVSLKVEAIKMLHADSETVTNHYVTTDEWLNGVGGKTLSSYKEKGMDAKAELGTDDPYKIGQMVKGWLVEYLTSGKIVAMVLSGSNTVKVVRKIVGHTLPVSADPSTIRGRFSTDSPDIANNEKRPVQNLIHASGNTEEAQYEIKLWFPDFNL